MPKKQRKTFLQVVRESRQQREQNVQNGGMDEIFTPEITARMQKAVQEHNRKAIESEIAASKLFITD